MSRLAPALDTRRLRLRPWTVNTLLGADRAMRELLGCTSLDAINTYVSRRTEHWEALGFGSWAVTEASSGDLIGAGGIELGGWPDEPNGWWGVPELTAMSSGRARNRGLATEAGAAVIDWAFTKTSIDRLYAIALPDNPGAITVMQKLGLSNTGITTDARTDLPEWAAPASVVVYEITKSDWSTSDR